MPQSADATSTEHGSAAASRTASTGEVTLGSLLEVSHHLAPDDVVPTVVAHCAAVGMTDVIVLLVDLDQRLLVPVGTAGDPVDIDEALPGRVFRTQ